MKTRSPQKVLMGWVLSEWEAISIVMYIFLLTAKGMCA